VEGITHDTPIFTNSSLTRWSNDEMGLAWLIQVLNKYTKGK
jgi:hypothetical protein